MIVSLEPYVVYGGQCREAIEFYAQCLEGTIETIQTYGDSPVDVGPGHADRIFNAVLVAGPVKIRASDDLPGHEVRPGNNISLFLTFDDPGEKQTVFNSLSRGGSILFPLSDNFGMLEDQYGVRWMFVHE